MIAVDTNILVYAHREESPWHTGAGVCLARLAAERRAWAIPWPCLHEFLAIATHPRIFNPPTPARDAIAAVDSWLAVPMLRLLGEEEGYWDQLRELVLSGQALGPRVHDARVAALCLRHGITELWSADRDFGRFRRLRVRNPLLEP